MVMRENTDARLAVPHRCLRKIATKIFVSRRESVNHVLLDLDSSSPRPPALLHPYKVHESHHRKLTQPLKPCLYFMPEAGNLSYCEVTLKAIYDASGVLPVQSVKTPPPSPSAISVVETICLSVSTSVKELKREWMDDLFSLG